MSIPDVRAIPLADTRSLRRRVLRPHQSLAELARDEPPHAWAAGAVVSGELIGVGLIAETEEAHVWRVRGMATDEDARGQGAGSAVLRALLDHAIAHGATRIWCNARTPALSLYTRAGFTAASAEFEIPPIGPHVVMELLIG